MYSTLIVYVFSSLFHQLTGPSPNTITNADMLCLISPSFAQSESQCASTTHLIFENHILLLSLFHLDIPSVIGFSVCLLVIFTEYIMSGWVLVARYKILLTASLYGNFVFSTSISFIVLSLFLYFYSMFMVYVSCFNWIPFSFIRSCIPREDDGSLSCFVSNFASNFLGWLYFFFASYYNDLLIYIYRHFTDFDLFLKKKNTIPLLFASD